jgi:hypothetical protein
MMLRQHQLQHYLLLKQQQALLLLKAPATTASKKDTEFLSTLLNISKIKVDSTIFASPAFNSLADNNVPIRNEEVVGRTNPFAPLEGSQNIPNTNTDKILGEVIPFTTN